MTVDPQENHPISRRDFMKVGAATALGLALSGGASEWLNAESKKLLEPEIIRGTEVYGINERVNSLLDITALYKHFDEDFELKNGITIGDKTEQRKELLNPKERYLEVVVRRSAYDSFQNNQLETNTDFVKWIQATLALSNTCMENAKPPSEMRGVLRRVIVVEDKILKNIWDEKAYRDKKGVALDWAWRSRFANIFPIDTDESWAVADDYRKVKGVNLWKISQNQDEIIAQNVSDQVAEQIFKFPAKEDTKELFNGITIDMGLPHEWSHYLEKIIDEYSQDVQDVNNFAFTNYFFDTGSFEIPYFSAYLSYLTKRNIDQKVRTLKATIEDRPKDINISIESNLSSADVRMEIRRVRLLDDSIYGKKSVPTSPDKTNPGNTITLSDDLFKDGSNAWLISRDYKDDKKSLLFPIACLNICKIAGLDKVDFKINFIEDASPKQTVQRMVPKDESEINDFMNEIQKNNWTPYATMKIPGTRLTFIWYLTDQ